MKKAVIAVLLCAVLAASVSANVFDLTPENFDEVVDGHKYAFVEFFAPWYANFDTISLPYTSYEARGAIDG